MPVGRPLHLLFRCSWSIHHTSLLFKTMGAYISLKINGKEIFDVPFLVTEAFPPVNASCLEYFRHKDFGYIRAIVYGYISGVPVKVMVAQQLFLLKKDLSKVCQGTRSEDNCKCNPGFEGNGIHCVDKDECVEGMPLVCLPQATCINTYGSYICQCPEGFEGDGLYSCIDIDECATEASHCNPKAICVNTLGSYICVCQSGFIERGNHCKERSTWTPWSPWSICTVSCVRQNQMRIRLCTHPESGMRCEGPSAQLKPCPVKNSCPVDSLWSPWTAWTPCPLSCGLAMVSRFRRCISPSPGHSGKNCVGSAYEEGSCGFPFLRTGTCRFQLCCSICNRDQRKRTALLVLARAEYQ
ncbi:coadhesin-like isoform X3 [Rhinatrema bivittatum]|uniref:coadhesin-like isoform X3 n=1 Tax=Rhinatrema bivittatum TaxID=194408 RepID=UPI00112C55F7|nr:coadhesin-like isoform X3 [Rhinatrema bivittatum]XP_029434914.1 coadhesin-like isoform X3 [Rhinatrema bivittatum]XP_029434915.1 coadhesin-like isoform X3 [Rhinatrema bivittatum]XP_029434918.1 coadhesin-like isoform X3 [Rhinatrema bivittatum]XP_029434919.1 coadhesin-like isoform X3 [Rhinatrema bivittatum]